MMKTEIDIDGEKFLINNMQTYKGLEHNNRSIEGLLFNSRMVQAIFGDENPVTKERWKYPDTGVWDPERNTDEFCIHLPLYRQHGLLGVTVGLQGGGSIYSKDVYDNYINSAFTPEGGMKRPYFDRLLKIIKTADENGMVVIVNFLYFKQAEKLKDEKTIRLVVEETTDWLLKTGYRNILVDIANESGMHWKHAVLQPSGIWKLIDIAKSITLNGRRLYISSSAAGGDEVPYGKWVSTGDFVLPHGNDCDPERLKKKIEKIRESEEFRHKRQPVLINEDSIWVDNLEAAIGEYSSWGYYDQGFGSDNRDGCFVDWSEHGREKDFDELSGFQTVPVNWGINTEHKRDFFNRLKVITGGGRN